MILVDVSVPALDSVYDFSISEDVSVGAIIEELAEMICHREKLTAIWEEQFSLCCVTTEQMLSRDKTLSAYGIGAGSKLMLL